MGGTFVAPNWDAVLAAFRDEEQAASLEDFHLLLECGLVARSAGELPADWSSGLQALVDEMNAADDHAELLRLEPCFHLGLAEALGLVAYAWLPTAQVLGPKAHTAARRRRAIVVMHEH